MEWRNPFFTRQKNLGGVIANGIYHNKQRQLNMSRLRIDRPKKTVKVFVARGILYPPEIPDTTCSAVLRFNEQKTHLFTQKIM